MTIPDGVSILDISVVEETSKVLETSATLSEFEGKKSILLAFDYMDNREGFLIQVVHDGPTKAGFRITGKIAGVKKIKFYHQFDSETSIERSTERIRRFFSYSPRLIEILFFFVYGGAGLLGLSLLFFGYQKAMAISLACMGLPALVFCPALFIKAPPINIYGEKKS